MPGVEDWVSCPLEIVQNLFDANSEAHIAKIKEYFIRRLQDKNSISWVPSLNDRELHNLRTNTLVRFRCMVQDMFDPEFYLGVYEVKDTKTGQSQLRSGKYRDIADCLPHQEILLESPKNVTMDRQTLYCVPVPGENSWVKQACSSKYGKGTASTSAVAQRPKRSLDSESEAQEQQMDETPTSSGATNTMETEAVEGKDMKRTKTEGPTEAASSSTPPNLNFPLPEEVGPACLVKTYENEDTFKVNDVVEFIGVLSNDPALASFADSKKEDELAIVDPDSGMEGVEEQNAHCPPPSLVPRLHVILANKLKHVNPHMPTALDDSQPSPDVQSIMNEARELRGQLLTVLEQGLFGDRLAAQYLLCHLASCVYARRDVVALGKFALNLSGCPRDSKFPSFLYKLIEQLVTKSYLLPMTLNNMNKLPFSPCKDYTANRLKSGILQLSDRTHLVMDETAMQPGQLDANGVRNITALGNVIRWQKVEYDFNFHRQDFEANLVVLVLSEGKSLLPCDCQVPIISTTPTGNLQQIFSAIESYLTPALLTKLQSYLTLIQHLDYTLSDDLQKAVEQDFVDMRRQNPANMTVEDFHALLVLARLLSLTAGQTSLNREIWEQAKSLETQRKLRLAQGATSSSG